MSKRMQGNIMLFLTALIWGTAFVAQSTGMDYVGPFTYNGVRNLIAAIVLIPIIYIFDRMKQGGHLSTADRNMNRLSLRYGAVCGIFLFIASSLQQYGISLTTAGKAGFITALYIILVPILGLFLHKKVSKMIWLCVAVAIAGFYLLCIKDGFSISTGDLLVLACAFFFSLHILVIDHYNKGDVDGVRMSQAQFLVAAALSVPFILLTELHYTEHLMAAAGTLVQGASGMFFRGLWNARWSILYTAVMSSGVAYTLQILGQRYTDPTTATLLMSLESVFAALFGWLLLHESLSLREMLGCALVFAAVLMAQLAPKPE